MVKKVSYYYTYIAYFEDNTFQSVGVTNNLNRRFKLLSKIKSKTSINCCKLVYYEEFKNSTKATAREKELNKVSEKLLKQLVAYTNPMFVNLN